MSEDFLARLFVQIRNLFKMKNMQSKWETQQKLVAGNCNQIFWFVKYLNAYKKSDIFSDSSCGSKTHPDGTRLHQEQFLSFGGCPLCL